MKVSRWLRALLPIAVTSAFFALISRQVDWSDVVSHLDADSIRSLAPACTAYIFASMGLDGASLQRMRGGRVWGWIRIKAATYPANLVHYLVGAGALTLLLRRRAGLTLADAAGTAMFLGGLDLLAVVVIGAAATALASDVTGLSVGLIALLLLGAPLGLWLLRTPRPLGPLEAMRSLGVFRAARDLPTPRLLELFAWRLGVVAVFIALGAAALAAFDVRPAPAALVAGVAQIALVAAVPIAVAGLGTSQAAFLYVFGDIAPAERLLACSVALSAGIILVRIVVGLCFVTEYTRPVWSEREAS